jgi:hypothetical protein
MRAYQQVIDGMQACLAKECPLPFDIKSAKFIKKHVALAHVTMFDGHPGTLQVSRVPYGGGYSGWCLQWQELAGGAINWNGMHWERVGNLCH